MKAPLVQVERRRSPVPKRSSIANQKPSSTIDNAAIAEWLALEAEKSHGHLQRAFRRASRAAFLWPVEAAQLAAEKLPLTTLPAVGPYLDHVIRTWLESPPPVVEPPPIRQSFLTFSRAKKILETQPGWAARYRGDLQMHSTWSDGSSSVQSMAEAARGRGYKYIAITDHSKGLKIAGGMDESELAAQGEEIKALNQKFARDGVDFRILRSIEMNLNPQGRGDMNPEALEELDLVVGSFHSALRKTEDQTERYLRALNNPHIHILGHPRGRIYNHRLGLKADWKRVFAEAARLDKAVEVDSYCDRQDLDIERLLLARECNVRIAIDTDAHHPEELAQVELGLAAVLLAGIAPVRVINFMGTDALLKWAHNPRDHKNFPSSQEGLLPLG